MSHTVRFSARFEVVFDFFKKRRKWKVSTNRRRKKKRIKIFNQWVGMKWHSHLTTTEMKVKITWARGTKRRTQNEIPKFTSNIFFSFRFLSLSVVPSFSFSYRWPLELAFRQRLNKFIRHFDRFESRELEKKRKRITRFIDRSQCLRSFCSSKIATNARHFVNFVEKLIDWITTSFCCCFVSPFSKAVRWWFIDRNVARNFRHENSFACSRCYFTRKSAEKCIFLLFVQRCIPMTRWMHSTTWKWKDWKWKTNGNELKLCAFLLVPSVRINFDRKSEIQKRI